MLQRDFSRVFFFFGAPTLLIAGTSLVSFGTLEGRAPTSRAGPKRSPAKTIAVPCARAGLSIVRAQAATRKNLTRLRNGIRDLKDTRGAFTPGGKRRLYRLEQKKTDLELRLKRLSDLRKRWTAARRGAKSPSACRFPLPAYLLNSSSKGTPKAGPGKRGLKRQESSPSGKGAGDAKALAEAREKKIAAARERLREIRVEIARIEKTLEKYRGRKVVHRRFKRRIRNYHALIARLRAEQADLRRRVSAKSPRPKR